MEFTPGDDGGVGISFKCEDGVFGDAHKSDPFLSPLGLSFLFCLSICGLDGSEVKGE